MPLATTLPELSPPKSIFEFLDNRFDCYFGFDHFVKKWISKPSVEVGRRFRNVFDPNSGQQITIKIESGGWNSRIVSGYTIPLSFFEFECSTPGVARLIKGEVWSLPIEEQTAGRATRLILREHEDLDLVTRDLMLCKQSLLFGNNEELRTRTIHECETALAIRQKLAESGNPILTMETTRNKFLTSLHLLMLHGLEWHQAARYGATIVGIPMLLSGAVFVDDRVYLVGSPAIEDVLDEYQKVFETQTAPLLLASAKRAMRKK